jgi:DNA-binding NtrC family response regulator
MDQPLTQSRAGRFERADGGALFLAEIDTLSAGTQGNPIRRSSHRGDRSRGLVQRLPDLLRVQSTATQQQHGLDRGQLREQLIAVRQKSIMKGSANIVS